MFENLKQDIKGYQIRNKGKLKIFFYLFFNQCIWAIVVYRFGSCCKKLRIPVFSLFLKIIYFFLNKIIEITTGISISSNAVIGKGLHIGHFGGIFINDLAKIGENCSIAQGVTIGVLGLDKEGVPIIGNNVFIGSGAKILGNISIGDNVRVGANAVVIKDVPANATVVGVPAKVVRIRK